jgi:hypothetical protein
MLMSPLKRITRHRDFYYGSSSRMNRFQEFGASTACFLLCRRCNLQFHSVQSSVLGQRKVGGFRPGTFKTGIEILGDLNGRIRVAIYLSLFQNLWEVCFVTDREQRSHQTCLVCAKSCPLWWD